MMANTSHTIHPAVEIQPSRLAMVHRPDDQLPIKSAIKIARTMLIAITPPSIVVWKFSASFAFAFTRALRFLNAARQIIEIIGIMWLNMDHIFSSLGVKGCAEPAPAGCGW